MEYIKMKRLLVMGLPGCGKTKFSISITAECFRKGILVTWLNADAIREQYNDWDFSYEGRIRQARRMRELADEENSYGRIAICDLVCPLVEMRDIIDADIVVWMNTKQTSEYEDTNKLFEPPVADYVIKDFQQNGGVIQEIINGIR